MTYAKLKISGKIVLESGLHIGTGNAFAAIGATDAPVIKDPITGQPLIPGSSLKGKLRTLLARSFNKTIASSPSQDDIVLQRLFGNSQSKELKIGRLIVRDAFLANAEELEKRGARNITEVKFENTIDRISAEAKPRQIERAIKGSKFNLELLYEMTAASITEVEEDFRVIASGLKLLELDYLGGSGSRGYGKVNFENLTVETVFGDYDCQSIQQLLIQEV